MPLDKTTTKYLYIGSAIAIILIIVLIAQNTFKPRLKYSKGAKIAVKTSKGLIKMTNDAIAEELAVLHAELDRHKEFERTSKFGAQIDAVMTNLREIINRSPNNELCNIETRTKIIYQVLSDYSSLDRHQQDVAYKTIMEFDELEYGSDEKRFDYMLKHIEILIAMLKQDICNDGLIDLDMMENLLRSLDEDLTENGEYYETPIGQAYARKYDPYIIPRLSLFESQSTQIEGFSLETKPKPHHKDKFDFILGAQNARNAQQRSQMFRENRRVLGNYHYNDEDLLYEPTYAQLEL